MIGLPSSVVADFLLLPVRLPQAARVAPRAITLADANAYFFPIFHKKNLLYVIFFYRLSYELKILLIFNERLYSFTPPMVKPFTK